MENEDNIDLTAIDFEDLDDLALPSRIDWDNDEMGSFSLDALDSTDW